MKLVTSLILTMMVVSCGSGSSSSTSSGSGEVKPPVLISAAMSSSEVRIGEFVLLQLVAQDERLAITTAKINDITGSLGEQTSVSQTYTIRSQVQEGALGKRIITVSVLTFDDLESNRLTVEYTVIE